MNSAQELKTHYATLKKKLWGPAPSPAVPHHRVAPKAPKQRKLTKAEISFIAKNYTPPPLPEYVTAPKLTFDDTLVFVCRRHKVAPGEVVSDKRDKPLVKARQELYYLLRKQGWTYPQIGRRLNRDHSSILHGVRKYIVENGVANP